MKRLNIILISLLLGSAILSSFWILFRSHSIPEVQYIYKVPSNEKKIRKQHRTMRTELSETDSDYNRIESPDETLNGENRSSILVEEGFSIEEEAAFWEWLASQNVDDSTEAVNDQHQDKEDVNVGYSPKEYSYLELTELVANVYDLETVLKMYKIEFKQGLAICPFCSDYAFSTKINGHTGNRDFWSCNCVVGPEDYIDFVVRIEGLDNRYYGAKYLAEQAGVLE